MSSTQVPLGPSTWTRPVTTRVPLSPKSLGGFQFFARVRLNAVTAAPLSPGNDGREDRILELSGDDCFESRFALASSAVLGSESLSIRVGVCDSCLGLLSSISSSLVMPDGKAELGFPESASRLKYCLNFAY